MTDMLILEESMEAISKLPDEDAGAVIKALIAHFKGEEVGDLPLMAGIVYPLIKGQCDRMAELRDRNRENGRKGGRPKKAEENQNETETKPKENPNETEVKAPVPNHNHNPLSPIGEKRKGPTGPKEKAPMPFDSEVFLEAWKDFRKTGRN